MALRKKRGSRKAAGKSIVRKAKVSKGRRGGRARGRGKYTGKGGK